MSGSVLYDAPGPRTRKRARRYSLLVGIAILVLIGLAMWKLAGNGQFSAEKWSALIDPGDDRFSQVWTLIGEGLQSTLAAAALAVAFSLVIGTLLAVSRVTAARWYRWAVVGVVEFLRGVPVVVSIFFAARVLPSYGADLPTMWYLVIGLTAYNSVIIAEIVRAGVLALPKGQSEAAYSVGLTRRQVYASVLLPQAFRAMLPALISQLVVILKDTSLGAIISYEELSRTGEIIQENLDNPIQTFFIVAFIYIVINYALSKIAVYTESRIGRGRKAGPVAQVENPAMADGQTAVSNLAGG